MSNILISTSYFPPISYLTAILLADKVTIEKHENYIKKTYRNRCSIYGANGVINLSVPVEEAARKKILIKDVKIDYSANWQKQHLKSIESAYNSSPFYEYLIDDFAFVFNQNHKYLFDLNNSILDAIYRLLEISPPTMLSEQFEKEPEGLNDLRNVIQKKNEAINPFVSKKEYQQVFSEKQGFQKDLSCLDLFFNLGSEAYSYLINKM